VKHALAVCLFALGLAAAGTFSAVVIADTGTTTSTSTTDTSTVQTTTTVATTTTTTSTTPAQGRVLPSGARVSGIDVSGLTPAVAVAVLQTAFAKPLPVIVDRTRFELDPTKFATAYAALAVAKARIAGDVQLSVNVNGAALRSWVGALANRCNRQGRDATLALKNGKPKVTPEVVGRRLQQALLARELVAALRTAARTPVRLRTQQVAPTVTAKSLSTVIVINRTLNRLQLYKTGRLVRAFPVATGQAIYPTPKGRFNIVVKWKNPWWYPPTQDAWAKGLKPVPPGPGNPLGTRWMGLSVPGVGIHGTDEPGSIGYSASHGCIRMQVPDAEWLFERVYVGTTVFIL
jgi:lipoprotein-anchoring transpeptidase ErfK/SrfK